MPDKSFQLWSDPLTYIVWVTFFSATAILFISRHSDFKIWLIQRRLPLNLLAVCYFFAFLVCWRSVPTLLWLGFPPESFQEVLHVQGMVSGPDLIVSFLMISALTVSAGFSYLCLPTDRAEMRLASMTKAALFAALIEPERYDKWYNSIGEAERTPLRKLLKGLLYPRDGLGGWYLLGPEDFDKAVGKNAWKRFARYVDGHLDDGWIRVCIYSLGTAMVMGMLCLFYRYFGFCRWIFHPTEFGVVTLLVLINFVVASLIVYLAFGAHLGETAIRDAIQLAVAEVQPAIQASAAVRRDADLRTLEGIVSNLNLEGPRQQR